MNKAFHTLTLLISIIALLCVVSNTLGQTLFFDDFEDGSADGWFVCAGLWNVGWVDDNYEYQLQSGPLISISLNGEDTWTDYAVEAKVKYRPPVRDDAGIIGRVQDCMNYYLFIVEKGGRHQVEKVVNGNREVLYKLPPEDAYLIDPTVFNTGKLEFEGTTIRAYINGEFLFEVEDSTFTSGKIGLWALHATPASFDDVLVTDSGCETGSIAGEVKDADTGKPIKGAFVIAIKLPSKEKYTALTDGQGYFQISDLAPGIYLLLAIKKGYKPAFKIVEVVACEETWTSFDLTQK